MDNNKIIDDLIEENGVLEAEIERLRAEVARLGSFLHPVGMVVNTYGTSLTKRARNET